MGIDWEGLSVLCFFCGSIWVFGLFRHKRCSPTNQYALHLPKFVAIFFGRFGKEKHLSFQGVLAQLFAIFFMVFLTLDIVGLMPRSVAIQWVGCSLVFLGMIILWIVIRRR